ncbi:MAG: hypothetical protein ABJA82_07435 [Myxococcales bacterium]
MCTRWEDFVTPRSTVTSTSIASAVLVVASKVTVTTTVPWLQSFVLRQPPITAKTVRAASEALRALGTRVL